MTPTCPKCAQGFDWPRLTQSGYADPVYFCRVCRQYFDKDGDVRDKPEVKDEVEKTRETWFPYKGGFTT